LTFLPAQLNGLWVSANLTLAYAYRSKYLVTFGPSNASQDQYTDSNGQLDVHIGYEVIPHAELYFEATNLSNAPWRRFIGAESQLVERA